MNTADLDFFNTNEITVTIPKPYLERLYNLLKDSSQNNDQSSKAKDAQLQERVQKMLQQREDHDILAYLDWVLKQNS
ncbi:hypothetical protein DSM106972_041100 [Dulcicalothrix desertica PCC 7102]|uniref:Uncharacterized protein n=1 Tax=Dulcicalothrix desertica PCC 7102 TaxID=232991 RepID=A0A3S1J055_9CYAN|nr:hypothetical protein [Dulcicalothrix desertica]RUT05289.1 hypothetical protein DSM106972_041100 [Dulcicalothrix desertica PCC 7102]TWH43210.1 hypothetical protein CAL7102_06915 [Dulcicalothrix desertica PCC 7102]